MNARKLALVVWGTIIFSLFIPFGAFTGCTMLGSDEDVDPIEEYADREKTLFGSISNLDSFFGAGNRTLFSDALSLAQETFYITGTSSNGAKLAPTSFSLSGNSFNVNIPRGYWQLTVFCVHSTNPSVVNNSVGTWDKSTILSNATLIGYLTADLSETAASLPVSLTTDGLAGTCHINANFVLSSDGGATKWQVPSGYSCNMYFRNLVRGDEVYYVGTTTFVSRNSVSFGPSSIYNFYGNANITCGNYSIGFEFFDSNGKPCGTWSDCIVLLPKRDFTSTVYIPNVIGASPAAPSNFTATYVEDSQDMAGHEDSFKVHFAWTDNSNNENYFELQVADVTGYGQDTLSASEWATYNSSKIFSYNSLVKYMGICADGSLESNNEGLTLWLSLGRKFQARIRACNNSAPSDWCYVTIPSSAAGIPYSVGTDTLDPFVITGSSTSAQAVGMFRIKYLLDGGSYWAAPYASVYGSRSIYYVQNTGANTQVWNGDGYSTTDPYASLKRENSLLSGWSYNANGFTSFASGANYTGTNNLELHALYGGSCSRPSGNSEYDLNVNWFTYKITQSGAITNVVSNGNYGKLGSITVSRARIPAGADTDLLVSVTVPTDTDPYTAGSQVFPERFDSYDIVVTSSSGSQVHKETRTGTSTFGVATTFNGIAIASLANGNYDFVYTASKKIGGIEYTWSVKIVVVITD
ncbi:MAG: hypothetical protein MJZ50_04975 [Treponema sp.]|nr:hypothetical protein [Treponema sp.]